MPDNSLMSRLPAAFGRNLARIRREQRFTKTELSRRVGVTRQAIANWETGTIPDFHNIIGLIEAMNISLADLFGETYEVRPRLTTEEIIGQIVSGFTEITKRVAAIEDTMNRLAGPVDRPALPTRSPVRTG